MNEGSSNQLRFCTNCGTQIRPETQFCVNCGASLLPNQETTEPSSAPSGPSLSERFESAMYSLGIAFSRLKSRFSTSSSDTAGNSWRGTPNRFLSWFRDIPIAAKFVFVGLVGIPGLVIIALLSPAMRIIAIVVFGMSILALIIRGVQRKSIREWGIIAAASFVSIFLFSDVSGIVYSSQPDNGTAGESEGYIGGDNPDTVAAPEASYPDSPTSTASGDANEGTLEVPVMDIQSSIEAQGILEIYGTADTLYEEDVEYIATYFDTDPYFEDYDAISIDVGNQAMLEGNFDIEMYNSCTIEIAKSRTGSLYYGDVPEGYYSNSCS